MAVSPFSRNLFRNEAMQAVELLPIEAEKTLQLGRVICIVMPTENLTSLGSSFQINWPDVIAPRNSIPPSSQPSE
jgi:hypothetical protein